MAMADDDVDRTGYGPGTHLASEGTQEIRDKVQMRQEAERNDRVAEALVDDALLNHYGEVDYHPIQRMLRDRVESIPQEKWDEALKLVPEGIAPENSPRFVAALADSLIGPIPEKVAEIDVELETIRKQMRESPREYYSSEKNQLRYRMLTRKRETLTT